MGRKQLLADFAACQAHRYSNIADLCFNANEESFSFSYLSEALPIGVVNIHVMIPETADYPFAHHYLLFVAQDDSAPPVIAQTLDAIRDSVNAMPFPQMLTTLSTKLQTSLTRGRESNPTSAEHEDDGDAVGDTDDDMFGEADSDGGFSDGMEFWPDEDMEGGVPPTNGANPTTLKKPTSVNDNRGALHRARSDLKAAKDAGFKVGILGDLSGGGIICVSVRVTKLGISEEAMQAWGLDRKHYLVLMIRFADGYKGLRQISEMPNLAGRTETRVALCKRYKPTLADALVSFTAFKENAQPSRWTARDECSEETLNPSNNSKADKQDTNSAPNLLEALFIGRPLDDLLRTRFATIIKYRLACGFKWTGAELFYNDNLGKSADAITVFDEKYYVVDNAGKRALPSIVTADAFEDNFGSGEQLSFPLVAMQFLLRHFVRCTEFCLVCHCKVDSTFEALRPYVCSKPLCLYQYMALGFGPSIEWEVLTQPYVVDLLVSFCYASARNGRLKDFPIGIGLNVPNLPHFKEYAHSTSSGRYHAPKTVVASKAPEKSFAASYDHANKTITLPEDLARSRVKHGDWIVLLSQKFEGELHCRVEDISYFPNIKVGETVDTSHSTVCNNENNNVAAYSRASDQTPTAKPFPPGSIEVDCYLYDKVFDMLSHDHKRQAINVLLDTLPDVERISEYLMSQSLREPSLQKCHRISMSALNLLRWVIASNRSCILQVDRTQEKHVGNTSGRTATVAGRGDRVSGMDGWMQFRFAQGAPDKEQRFVDSVTNKAASNHYPTLFAWHGSPLSNWHSIIRQGLNFDEILCGRAFGNGVYMSPQATTSIGYSGANSYFGMYGSGPTTWPNSVLRVQAALALNEVVNSPIDFVSVTPHYVVAQTDWIQTRYLFVKASSTIATEAKGDPPLSYQQDPSRKVYDEMGKPITIPMTAISKSRRPAVSSGSQRTENGSKKSKQYKETDQMTAEIMEDDANSIVSDEGDRAFLQSDNEDEVMVLAPEYRSPGHREKRSSDVLIADSLNYAFSKSRPTVSLPILPLTPKTDFVRGSLNFSNLKMLFPPKDASPSTTKVLMRTLKDTLAVQECSPLHELGWYIDENEISNIYQWIVELHSFDSDLPLAQDMKAAQVSSIVLEIRFTNGFPFSPPFVRVVRPRFLPFQAGGGGHVTAGGALCMELLTNSGWSVASTIENVLVQIRMAITSTEPRPARLERGSRGSESSYSVGEAIDAYRRACQMHGWAVPRDFDTLQRD